MKIDQSKFPALFDNDIVIRKIKPWADRELIDIYYNLIDTAKLNLHYVSSTIIDYIEESFPKLMSLRDDIPDTCRGLLFKLDGKWHSIFYTMTNNPDRVVVIGQLYVNDDQGRCMGDVFGGFFPKNEEKLMFHQYEYFKSEERIIKEVIQIVLANELFFNYAEIETKEVKPNRQIWDGPICLYNNKTKFPITVVDSSWYTNLISSGAFKVRGHFRGVH